MGDKLVGNDYWCQTWLDVKSGWIHGHSMHKQKRDADYYPDRLDLELTGEILCKEGPPFLVESFEIMTENDITGKAAYLYGSPDRRHVIIEPEEIMNLLKGFDMRWEEVLCLADAAWDVSAAQGFIHGPSSQFATYHLFIERLRRIGPMIIKILEWDEVFPFTSGLKHAYFCGFDLETIVNRLTVTQVMTS